MNKSFIMKFCALLFVMTIVISSFSSCRNANIPMPTAAKPINADEFTVPFPVFDKFTKGDEQWIVTRNNINELILQVTFNSSIVAQFPVNMAGYNEIKGEISLDGKRFKVMSVTLNSDQTSGYVTLKKI